MAIENVREGTKELDKYAKGKPINGMAVRSSLNDRKTDPFVLELICKLLITDNRAIRRGQLINIQNYIDSIDPAQYMNDERKRRYIEFIRRGLDARLNYNLTNPDFILHHINGGIITDNPLIDPNTFKGLAANEIDWINGLVSESLKFSHIDSDIDAILDACTRFKTRDYGNTAAIVNEIEGAISNLQNKFRQSRNETHIDAMFSLADGAFEDSVHDTYNQLANPKRKLITGMQGLNELLGGGFEAGRVYVFFGLPGEGKSTVLINILYQLKMYNKDYKCKDITKKPCVVLLTMENVVSETTERLFSVSVDKGSMIDFDVNDVINMMRLDGGLELNEASPINIFVKYMPTGSVDTSYLYTLTEDLEDMGYEVIAFIQDYIARIRSTTKQLETRLEYGAITDEFKTFAEIKDIPVITASQLNRDAAKHIDEGRKKNNNDLVRSLGRSNISESMLILNNIDAGFVLAPEVTRNGDRYMGIQRIKIRYRASDMEYVYIPFVHNGIKLSEDFGIPPTYKKTLIEGFGNENGAIKTSQYQTNAVYDMNSIASLDNDDDSLFAGANFISGDNNIAEAMPMVKPILKDPIVYLGPDNPPDIDWSSLSWDK